MQQANSISGSATTLQKLEHEARQKIEASTTPYIGLIPELLAPDSQRFIADALHRAGGQFSNLESGLKRFPALFLSYIVISLKQSLGPEKSSVYDSLSLALSPSAQYQSRHGEREALWRAFRRACQKLELPVSNRQFGSNYMVDAYLEQTGIAEANLDKVWDRMNVFARKHGLPDEYDLHGQQLWYSRFCASLNKPFSVRSKRALENDATGYYLQQFYLACSDSATSINSESFQDVSLPYLMFDGDTLALAFSASTRHQIWTLDIDGHCQRIETGAEVITVDLETYDTNQVSVSSLSEAEFLFTLWQSDRNNQFAFFEADTHRFISSHSLTEDGVVLNPGRYRILSRFSIELDWLHTEECLECDFYWGEFQLDAGKKAVIERGPATFLVRTHSHAVLELEGPLYTPYSGVSFYSSETLNIKTKLPEEWELGTGDYELVLSIPSTNDECTVPLTLLGNHQASVSMASISESWGNTFNRVNISLRKTGQKRPLARTSCMVWFGLQELAGGFMPVCSKLPENLSIDFSENIRHSANMATLVVKDVKVPFLTLGFKVNKRLVQLKFALPGTYTYLEHTHEDVRREILIPSGTTLSASYHDRRLIRIYSTEHGQLMLGDKLIYDNFVHKPWIKLSLASLLDHIEGQNNCLTFVSENYSTTLLKLVSPHNITEWKAESKQDSIDLSFTTHAPLEIVNVTARELLTEKNISQEFQSDQLLTTQGSSELNGMLISSAQAPYHHQLTLSLAHLPDGLWFFQFNAKINGRWGVLSNVRQDQYAQLIYIESGWVKPDFNQILNHIQQLSLPRKNMVLMTVNGILRTCFEKSCWESVHPLKKLWQQLLRCQDVTGVDNLRILLPFTEVLPDENASPSWVPLLHIGAYNTNIYTAKGVSYRRIDTAHSVNLRCYKAINESAKDLGQTIRTEIIESVVAVAFSNSKEFTQGKDAPINLSLETFGQLLHSTYQSSTWEKLQRAQSEPSLGELLGSYHLLYCQKELLTNLRRTEQGNDYLRPAMLRLANRCRDSNSQVMPSLIPQTYFSYEREGIVLQEVSRLASILARTCREQSRGKNILEILLNRLRQELPGEIQDLHSVLSFFLSVAGSLFHYYLLLWEVYFISRD